MSVTADSEAAGPGPAFVESRRAVLAANGFAGEEAGPQRLNRAESSRP